MDSLIHQLRELASKSNIQFKLAAGLFYTKKGFISMGFNSTRTYINKKITPSIHAEHDAIYNCRNRFKNIKTRNLKLMVIRVSNSDELLNSKPCLNCTEMIRAYGIRKVYYINEENKLVFERVHDLHKYRLGEPGMAFSTALWFHSMISKPTPILPYLQSLLSEPYKVFSKAMGKKIESLRNERKWTQQEFAYRIGVHLDVVVHMEEGVEPYSSLLVNKLKRCLGPFSW